MEIPLNEREKLKANFLNCQHFFIAIGNEIRQQIILLMLTAKNKENRVIDISNQMSLSRPAVSHHIQILKNAGIVVDRRDGKFLYYSLCPDYFIIDEVINLLDNIKWLISQM